MRNKTSSDAKNSLTNQPKHVATKKVFKLKTTFSRRTGGDNSFDNFIFNTP